MTPTTNDNATLLVAPRPDPEAQALYEQARRALLKQLQASANLSMQDPGR